MSRSGCALSHERATRHDGSHVHRYARGQGLGERADGSDRSARGARCCWPRGSAVPRSRSGVTAGRVVGCDRLRRWADRERWLLDQRAITNRICVPRSVAVRSPAANPAPSEQDPNDVDRIGRDGLSRPIWRRAPLPVALEHRAHAPEELDPRRDRGAGQIRLVTRPRIARRRWLDTDVLVSGDRQGAWHL